MVDFGYPLIWSEMYGSLQTILAKDVVGTIKLLNEEAQTELAEERADAFTVLGFPTGPEGPVGSIDKSKVLWGVYFESKAAYNKSAALKSKLTTFSKTGNIQQDMYGFIGLVLHLDSPDVRRGKTPTFAVLTSIKALNAEGAASIVDVQKRHGATMIKASAGKCFRITIYPATNDGPEGSNNTVQILEQWTSEADYDTYVVFPGRTATPALSITPFVEDVKKSVSVTTFDKNVKHLTR